VLSGRVSVASANDKRDRQLLIANQRSRHTATGELLELNPQYDAERRVSWIGKAFNFRSAPVAEIASLIEERFGQPIVVETTIRECVVTANFSDETLEEMMQALAVLVGGSYRQRDAVFYLNGTGCTN